MEKKLVRISDTPYINIDTNIIIGELDQIIKNINDLKIQLKNRIDELKVNNPHITKYEDYVKIEISGDISYDDIYLIGFRYETNEEYDKRIDKLKKREEYLANKREKDKLAKEKRERTIFEKLKKKYENI